MTTAGIFQRTGGAYLLGDNVQRYVEHQVKRAEHVSPLEVQRSRVIEAKAIAAEKKNALAARELVPIEIVSEWIDTVTGRMKASLAGAAATIARQLAGRSHDVTAIKRTVSAEHVNAMNLVSAAFLKEAEAMEVEFVRRWGADELEKMNRGA